MRYAGENGKPQTELERGSLSGEVSPVNSGKLPCMEWVDRTGLKPVVAKTAWGFESLREHYKDGIMGYPKKKRGRRKKGSKKRRALYKRRKGKK